MEYDTIDNVTGNTQNAPMPYFAKDFRQIAWNALGERNQFWRFVAGMIILSVILGISIFAAQAFLELLHKISGSSQSYSNFAELVNDPFFWRAIVPVSILLATGCTYMIGFVAWAYSKMALNTLNRKLAISDAFDGFGNGWHMVWVLTVKSFYIFLWWLLFIIPAIIKSLSYSLTEFLAIDHPDWTPGQCISESSRLMYGHRKRYFFLNFSFIGWFLLAAIINLIPVIGVAAQMAVQSYVLTAQAAFYRNLLSLDAQKKANAQPAVS